MQEQVDAGLLTPDQARVHPYSNVITRCVGASGDVVPDIYFGALEQGDIMLLASDGLTGMLEDEQLDADPRSEGGPQHWVDRMITEANRRGGLDNITAIVVRIESVDSNTGETPAVPAAAGRERSRLTRGSRRPIRSSYIGEFMGGARLTESGKRGLCTLRHALTQGLRRSLRKAGRRVGRAPDRCAWPQGDTPNGSRGRSRHPMRWATASTCPGR